MKNLKENRFYVYALLDTRNPGKYQYFVENIEYSFDYEPFYIGKGSKDRLTEHFQPKVREQDTNKFKQRVITKIINETGKNPKSIKILKNLYDLESYELEEKFINIIGRRDHQKGPLTNLSDSGRGKSGNSPPNKGIPMSLEQSIKLSESHKGFRHTEESKEKLTKSLCKNTYKLISPSGEEFIINNITKFSKEHKIASGAISKVLSGKQSHCNGWRAEFITRVINPIKYTGFYKLIDSNKFEYTTNSLQSFCKKFKLCKGAMNAVSQDKFKQHMGWNVYRMDIIDISLLTNYYPPNKNLYYNYILTDETKNVYETNNLKEFCRTHNLNSSHMASVCSGKRKQHKGWTGTRELKN